MDLENLNAVMNASMIFSIYYGDLPAKIVEKLKTEIILLFGRDNAVKLDEGKSL